IDREMLLLVPPDRMWRDLLRGEVPRHLANRNLVLVQRELHALSAYPRLFRTLPLGPSCRHCERSEAIQSCRVDGSWIASSLTLLAMTELRSRSPDQFMVGIENSAPSLTPDGQREVTVLVLV